MAVAEMTIADVLRSLINRPGMSERKLAAYLGVSPTALNRWAKGESIPDPRYVWKIAERAHIPVEEAMRFAGHLPEITEPQPEPEIIPEIREALGRMTPEEQRELVLGAIAVVEAALARGGRQAP